ncbi:alcohol dehydrogenase [Mycobacterium sp. GA-1841]|uniref:quinone oxidoreductase family protein n=1 Tax=Mycobacterium sp. GA-1841 TaxID=1834154 RepID=UPI00096C6E86|nr:zinc-binding alcohol dehydrogenase family protein [Mycobacterium sp. GA-1841]OMC31663.1 alcohol dehydrogenase [Mycobacterium sp. GA-1841]
MKAALVTEWDATPVYTDVPEPTPRDDAEVAEVEASALTNLARGVVSGKHYASKEIQLPAIPGVDGVARLADGRRIYTAALGFTGMMAQRALVDAHGGVTVPEQLDSVTAAALPNPGISAWTALSHAAAVKPGDHVLILGATGVTGSMAAQLAVTMFGAGSVVVAGRNSDRLAWLRSAGAHATITLGEQDLGRLVTEMHADHPFDAVLDYLWGEPATEVLTALAASHPAAHYHSTRFIQIGSMTGPTLSLDAGVLRSTGITLSGVGFGSVPPEVMTRARTEVLPELFSMVADGRLDLRTQPRALADVAEAWAGGEPAGTRVVLTP